MHSIKLIATAITACICTAAKANELPPDSLSVYRYNSQAAALTAVALVDAGAGLPASGGVTQTCCEVFEYDGYWYIRQDETSDAYLPAEVVVKIPVPGADEEH